MSLHSSKYTFHPCPTLMSSNRNRQCEVFTDRSLLYNLVWILLYRPLLTVRNHPSAVNSAFQICRSAAIDIHEILSLWGRTWGNVNMVYLAMYTTFVAAGVDVILLRIGDAQMKDEALKRIHLSLSILEQASDQGPGQ